MYDYILKLANVFSNQIVKLSALGYHVSREQLEVGKTYWFDPAFKGKGIGHTAVENILENVRSKEFPDKPQRQTSFFSYPYPKSPWESYGTNMDNYYLYEVEPIGKIHVGDVEYINQLDRYGFMDEYVRSYWEGKSYDDNLSNLEIVSSGIKILNEVNKRKIKGNFRLKTNISLADLDHKVHKLAAGSIIYVSAEYDPSNLWDKNQRKPRLKISVMNKIDTVWNIFPFDYQPKQIIPIIQDIWENKFQIVEPE